VVSSTDTNVTTNQETAIKIKTHSPTLCPGGRCLDRRCGRPLGQRAVQPQQMRTPKL
jgi:hypothetical protein